MAIPSGGLDNKDLFDIKRTCPVYIDLEQNGSFVTTISGKWQQDFLELPLEVVHALAEDDDLVIFEKGLPLQHSERELALLKAILKYIEASENKDVTLKLVKAVRLPFIDKNILERHTHLQHILKTTKELSGMFEMAIWIKSTFSTNLPKHLIPENWLRPRRRFLHHFIDRNSDQHVFATVLKVGKPLKWFDDGKAIQLNKRLIGLSVLLRYWDRNRVIGGLEVKYSDGTVSMHGMKGNNGCIEIREFTLDTDELITKVGVRSGWMIDKLIFHTNKGNIFGPFGGNGGEYKLVAPTWNYNSMTYLHGFSGGEVLTQGYLGITFLRLVWSCIDSDNSRLQ